MRTLTIEVPDYLVEVLEREAEHFHVNTSEIIRGILERALVCDSGNERKLSFIGMAESGDPYFAEKVDEYLAEHWAADIEKGWRD